MGVVLAREPKSTVWDMIVKMVKSFAEGFMDFANVGFRYIDNPHDHGIVMPKKRDD